MFPHPGGVLPSPPDFRDHPAASVSISPGPISGLPPKVDLRQWAPPIRNQGTLPTCTAFAWTGVIDYWNRKKHGRETESSPLFLYRRTCDLQQTSHSLGAYLRTAAKALTIFGVPPERYWPYVEAKIGDSSPSWIGDLAQSWQGLEYVRHDPPGTRGPLVLQSLKRYLAAGFPAVLGVPIFGSYNIGNPWGAIPLPGPNDSAAFLHAFGVFGYDDHFTVINPRTNQIAIGCLLLRNSWGSAWTPDGSNWLPYQFVTDELAFDVWSLIRQEWLDLEV